MAGTDAAAVLAEHGGRGFGPFKDALAGLLVARLAPITAETTRLLADEAHLRTVLAEGATRARARADPIVADVERLVGFLG